MLEAVLERYEIGKRERITIKTAVSAGLVVLAVLLPQMVHILAGQMGGILFLPMYLPVLLGGCLLGVRWGLCVALFSPMLSFCLTSLTGYAMPSLERLPFMMAELAVFAVVAGLFTKKVAKKVWMVVPAVVLASLSGRLLFLGMAGLFQNISGLSFAFAWMQVQKGVPGLMIQWICVPAAVFLLAKHPAFKNESGDDK